MDRPATIRATWQFSNHEAEISELTACGCSISIGAATAIRLSLLHATGFLGRIYAPIANALTGVGQVYSYDQRGHGDSRARADGQNDWQRTMDDLAGFIIAMGLRRVRAFGHSAGATAIGSLACDVPDLIRARCSLSRSVRIADGAGTRMAQSSSSASYETPDASSTASVQCSRIYPQAAVRYLGQDRWCATIASSAPAINGEGKRELKCKPEIEAGYYQTSRDFDGLAALCALRLRCWCLFGDEERLAGSAARRLRWPRSLRIGRVEKVADTGHFMPMEKPAHRADGLDFFSQQ